MYAGQWRMIGGKVHAQEKAYEAGLRELKEETGLTPELFWTLPSVNQFYDAEADLVHQIPAFAAEVSQRQNITLNHEHVDFKWISKNKIAKYILWPEQRRLIRLLISIITNNQVLDEWIIKN